MWWAKFEFKLGMTETFPGTAQMLESRYIAASKLPVKRRALIVISAYLTCFEPDHIMLTQSRTNFRYWRHSSRSAR